MKKRILLCMILLGFYNNAYSAFHHRPEYAQTSNLAYSNSLGFASLVLPSYTSSIMQSSSFLFQNTRPVFGIGYGYTQFASHTFDLSYVSEPNSRIIYGLEFLLNFIPENTYVENSYFTGNLKSLGFEQVLAAAVAYSFNEFGYLGFNLKIPLNYYSKTVDGGFLLSSAYHINLISMFDFFLGLSNLGAMYANEKLLGVYPDIQLGVRYIYRNADNESLFEMGFSLENNLGELINESLVIGLGGRFRVFSTGSMRKRPMIEDDIINYREEYIKKDKTVQESLASLNTSIYLNVGFQFATESRFSIGVSAYINEYLLESSLIFPNAITKKFGIYVSSGKLL